jgi:hypothetical protein
VVYLECPPHKTNVVALLPNDWLTAELRRWGHFEEAIALDTGFPAKNMIARLWVRDYSVDDRFKFAPVFRDPPGHKILCMELPADLVKLAHAIAALDRMPKRAVWTKYVFDRWPTSVLVTDRERAGILKVSFDRYKALVHQGRKAIRRNLRKQAHTV